MDLPDDFDLDAAFGESAPAPQEAPPRRELAPFMRKIPVTLTLEVGTAEIPLSDLFALEHGSVLPLDKHAGEALDIKINGTRLGRAEVVVVGDNYGLRIVELDALDLTSLTA